MSTPELCPAHRYDDPEGPQAERVVCILEPSIPAMAWAFICWSCWNVMLDGKARREEWEL